MRTRKPPVASEHQEQATLFKWAELESRHHPELALMFAIPNGSHKSMAQAMKFKREGLKKGVPDIFLPVPVGSHCGMFLEMKRVGGKVSEEQWEWMSQLRVNGYYCAVGYGWQDASALILRYLRGEAL